MKEYCILYLTSVVFICATNSNQTKCYQNFLHDTVVCKLVCPHGSFALPGMKSCQPWLNCDAEFTVLSLISSSVVKTVYLADWKGYNVTLSVLSSPIYKDDFLHNLDMMKSLSPHKFVVQLLGYCRYSLMTEYHELGSASNINIHLKYSLKAYDTTKIRFKFCYSYVSIIHFLHNSPVGVRVMCDTNSLEKTLSQYLITPDLELVVNDLDATPVVDFETGGIHCGNKELTGTFIAPEQVWPYPNKEFGVNEMPLYDEKTDIFKIPDICNWLLGNSPDSDVIKYKLFNIHKDCKNSDPYKRPNAYNILKEYENILQDIL